MTHAGTNYEHSEVKASFDQRNQWHWCELCKDWFLRHDPINIMIGVCREDNRFDVDEAYGAGTYDRLFPESDDECPDCHEVAISNEHKCEPESEMERRR